MTVSLVISCSKVEFNNAPSGPCAAADSCVVDPNGETLSKRLVVPYPNTKVDLLFVVDNSRTMTDEQTKIAQRLSGFINSISGLDWRIAVTTTDNKPGSEDYRDAKLVPFLSSNSGSSYSYAKDGSNNNIYVLTKNVSNYTTLFQNTVYRPESYQCSVNPSLCPSFVSGDERGIYSSIRNIQANARSFMRADAQLHVVIISDEDERSNGGGYSGMAIEAGKDRPEDLLNVLRALNRRTRVHSIVAIPSSFAYSNFDFNACVGSQINNVSSQEYAGCHYLKSSVDSGGIVGNKNVSDYTSILSAIGSDIQDTSISRFSFNCVPSEIEVEAVPGKPYPNNLTNPQMLSSNGESYIDFSPALTAGTEMMITWKCPRNQ